VKLLLVLPLLIPLTTAAVSLLAWRWRHVQLSLGVLGAAALLAAALALLDAVWREGIQALQLGSWPAPFGITLVADLWSALMVVLTGLMGLVIAIYSLVGIDTQRQAFGYYPLLHILLMGVGGAFLTGDIFNLYVWFEVMLIASFVLMALGGERAQMAGALKYVTLNLIASAVFLATVGILYGVAGTLNLADLAVKLHAVDQPWLVTTLAVLFLIAFGIKAAIFPLFFWLPASYHTPPVAVTALFAALLTKVGVYSLIRVFTLLFVQDVAYTHTLILTIAGLTMVTGVLGAVAQNEIRRLLSFNIISEIGYLLLGLGIFTPLALAGVVFLMVHVILSNSALFLISGVIHRCTGTYRLKELGGLYQSAPYLALLFLIPALALAGIPPLSGFWAKLLLVKAGLEAGQYAIIVAALVVSLLILFAMARIWAEAFWKPLPAASHDRVRQRSREDAARLPILLWAPPVALALLIVAIGLSAEPLVDFAMRAGEQLMNPSEYIRAVLGDRP
jgi:multicomponent Na+:H+ antiporter subunit D